MEKQNRKKTHKPIWILLLSLVCVAVIFAGVWFVLHEKTQNSNIVTLAGRAEEQTYVTDSLSAAIGALSERVNRQDKNREPVEWGAGYNWFAIGNSLTLIERFGHGICSTQPDNDYFGIVKAYLETQYDDVTAEVLEWLARKVDTLHQMGVADVIADPGFGFSKTLDQNYEMLSHLNAFVKLDVPLLVGVSRKSMIYKFFGTTPAEALNGTTVLNTLALLQGAHILRVHDVKMAKEAVKLVMKTYPDIFKL